VRTIEERLAEGTAFVDASSRWATGVSGADARSWLNDLVSADLDGLAPGRAVPSLLLAPTGGVRAAFTVVADADGLLLLQDRAQDRSVAEVLAMYVLSSDVALADRTGELAILAFPGLARPPAVEGAGASAPSVLGAGADLIAPAGERARIVGALAERFAEATPEDAEAWRIAAGFPRLGIDTAEGDLPQEVALEDAVSYDKGCFVGQEAVAKTRNRGHPRRVLVPVAAAELLRPGEAVLAGDVEVGAVTSATRRGDGTLALVRIRWADRDADLRAASGAPLARRR
jgi:tRNA-modifying protein YgfZ